MSVSPELATVKNCTSQLETILKRCDRNIVHFLHNEGFIGADTYDEVLDPQSILTRAQRAGKVVNGIVTRIELDPPSFRLLVNCFKEGGKLYQPIVRILETEYNSITCHPLQLQHDRLEDEGKLHDH